LVVKGAADLPGGQDASPEQNKVKEIPQNCPQGEIQGEATAAGAAGSDRSRGSGRTAGAAGEVRVSTTRVSQKDKEKHLERVATCTDRPESAAKQPEL
jgi:hypothetical protein